MTKPTLPVAPTPESQAQASVQDNPLTAHTPREVGGRQGLDPVRYGDWEKKGKCVDF